MLASAETLISGGSRDEEASADLRQDRFRDVLEGSPDAISIFESVRDELQNVVDFRLTYANAFASALARVPLQEMIGRRVADLFPQLRFAGVLDKCAKAIRSNRPVEFEIESDRTQAERFQCRIIPLTDGVALTARDVTERRRAEDAHSRLKAIVESTDDAVIGVSLEGIIETWNTAAEQLFGYLPEEVIGQRMSLLVPTDLLDEQAQIVEAARSGPVKHYETRRRRKDGTLVDISLAVSPIRDANGQLIGVSSIARDITEGKMAERMMASLKEKEVLLKEVHHRVKNNLQVISSLLNLQAKHVVDRKALEMFKESQNRVRSIALFHERLYQSKDLAHVEAAEYLKNLIDNLLATYGARPSAVDLRIEPDDVLFGVDVAIPVGLVVNELISNALKHAFPEGKRGRVRVLLHREGQDSYTLQVSDDGIGFPPGLDFRSAPSLGLQLVCTLTEQLGGTIELNSTNGTTFKVTFEAVG
jgi:PAS domain S-box-containing protein